MATILMIPLSKMMMLTMTKLCEQWQTMATKMTMTAMRQITMGTTPIISMAIATAIVTMMMMMATLTATMMTKVTL